MAPPEAAKLLQKLKVDTSGTSPDAYRAVIVSSDSQHGQRIDSFIQEDGRDGAPPKPMDYFAKQSPLYTNAQPTSGSQPSVTFEINSGVASLNSTGDTEESFRSRQTSISFASKATTDSGGQVALNEPLTKGEVVTQPRGRSIIAELYSTGNKAEQHEKVLQLQQEQPQRRSHSESNLQDYDPHTGQRLGRPTNERPCRTGEKRWPLLQSTVNGLAGRPIDHRAERRASDFSSDRGREQDGNITPSELSSSVLLSPLSESSPVSFSSQQSPWSRRPGSVRARSERPGMSRSSSGRRSTRRTSTMSSRSPASQFLMRFSSKDGSTGPEPDEEGEEIDNTGYIIGAQVGSGGFSTIKEVFSFRDGEKVKQAVKIVRKRVSEKSEEENDRLQSEFAHEVSIWRFLKHPYILPLIVSFESPFATFCITRMNEGGTLFDLVHERRRQGLGGLPSALARRYAYQLASAIRYLHDDVFVVHRDVKLENVLVDMTRAGAHESGGDILLCDFGMADFINNDYRQSPEPAGNDPDRPGIGPSHSSTSITGSINYAAPELIDAHKQVYSPAIDMWAYGCVIYALLTARLAFSDSFTPRMVIDIQRGNWDQEALLKSEAARDSLEDVTEFVRGCLEVDPVRRWDITDVVFSRWLDGCRELYEDRECDWMT